MGIRKYIIYSLIYIVLVFIGIYSINSSGYNFELFGQSLNLPVALWFVLPIILFAILSVLHIAYQSFEFFLKNRALKRDAKTYSQVACELLLGFESNKEFKTEIFDDAVEILKLLLPNQSEQNTEISIKNEELKEIFEIIKTIKNGEFADIKKFKLPKNSALFIQNEINKIEKKDGYYVEILKSNLPNLSQKIIKKAEEKLIKSANFDNIIKFKQSLNNEESLILLDRYTNENDKFSLKNEEIVKFLQMAQFSENDFINVAKILVKTCLPDSLIEIFKTISSHNQDAQKAYFYVLYNFQMLDILRENLLNSEKDNFEEFENLLFLRDNGKNPKLELFFH